MIGTCLFSFQLFSCICNKPTGLPVNNGSLFMKISQGEQSGFFFMFIAFQPVAYLSRLSAFSYLNFVTPFNGKKLLGFSKDKFLCQSFILSMDTHAWPPYASNTKALRC